MYLNVIVIIIPVKSAAWFILDFLGVWKMYYLKSYLNADLVIIQDQATCLCI